MQTNSNSTVSRVEMQLIEAARAGETSGLVEYLYTEKLMPRAVSLVNNYRRAYGVCLDAEDVAMAGVCEVLRGLDKALRESSNPIGWLLWGVQHTMVHYCQENRSPIRVPHAMQSQGRAAPQVFSLDAPAHQDSNLTLLDALAERSRAINGHAR